MPESIDPNKASDGFVGRRTLSHRLSTKPALFGLMQRHPHPTLAELAAISGYDFIVLDEEHGLFSESDLLYTLWAASRFDLAVYTRLRGHDLRAIGRYLDLGIDGFLVPSVSTAEQAQELVRAMSYPPSGTRGFGASAHRATRYGTALKEHVQCPRADAALLVIVETVVGVENVKDILAIDGVNGVIIGPWDLSAELGTPGNFSSKLYEESMNRIESAALEQGKHVGTAPHAGYPLDHLLSRGHRLLILGTDISVITEGMRSQLMLANSLLSTCEEDI